MLLKTNFCLTADDGHHLSLSPICSGEQIKRGYTDLSMTADIYWHSPQRLFQSSQHTILGYYGPTSETSFEWCFPAGLIVALWVQSVCNLGYQSTSADAKADSICCEGREKGHVSYELTQYVHMSRLKKNGHVCKGPLWE